MKKLFVFIKHHSDLDKVTEWKFYKEFVELGINAIPVVVNFSYIFEKDGKFYIKNKFIKNEFRKVEIEDGDLFFIRAASLANRNSYRLMNHLTELGSKLNLKFYNGNTFMEMCNDKFQNYLFLKEQNIGTPETYFVPYVEMNKGDKQLKTIAKKLGYPLIMKTVEGSMGTGVVKIESDSQIQSIAEVLYKQNSGLILQKMIKSEFDVRVFVWGRKIITSMRRNQVEGDFRSNVSKGSKAEAYELSKKELEFVTDIIDKTNDKFGTIGTIGIDYMVDGDGSLQVLEINGSPGIKIKNITGVDVLQEIGKEILTEHPDVRNTQVKAVEENKIFPLSESVNKSEKYINENYIIDYTDNTISLTKHNKTFKIVDQIGEDYIVKNDEGKLIEIINRK